MSSKLLYIYKINEFASLIFIYPMYASNIKYIFSLQHLFSYCTVTQMISLFINLPCHVSGQYKYPTHLATQICNRLASGLQMCAIIEQFIDFNTKCCPKIQLCSWQRASQSPLLQKGSIKPILIHFHTKDPPSLSIDVKLDVEMRVNYLQLITCLCKTNKLIPYTNKLLTSFISIQPFKNKYHCLVYLLWLFTPQPLRAVGVLFSPMVSEWVGGRPAGRIEFENLVRAISRKP